MGESSKELKGRERETKGVRWRKKKEASKWGLPDTSVFFNMG